MAPVATDKGKGPAVPTYSTAGTVSSPLDLDNVKGEHQSVNVSGGRRKVVSPKVKVTLTSLTVNNVSPCFSGQMCKMEETDDIVWDIEEDQFGRHTYCLLRQILQGCPFARYG
jgi:hypothetical protein